jgi:hypothetical protein
MNTEQNYIAKKNIEIRALSISDKVSQVTETVLISLEVQGLDCMP